MSRYSTRLLGPALLALVLLLLPSQANAGLDHQDSVTSTAERRAPAPGLLLKLRDFLSALWAENGSILDPNGGGTGTISGVGDKPANSGDNGSILDPDGRP
jgi:hypothetical protein